MVGFWNVAMLCWFLALCVAARGDPGDRTFLWKFGGNFVSLEFSECQKLPIKVVPLTSNSTYKGVGPYYLFAFEAGGIPSSSMIGTDPENLSWQNTHKQGASLMLIVVDSKQNVGGLSTNMLNVTAGSDTSCLAASNDNQKPPAIASITPNVTGRIETCDSWGLTVTGGKKPYQVVLSALNSPVITNVTMGGNDDVFTFVNRADPGELLMASVVDANGVWGISSPLIMPYGSKDVDCTGLVSTSMTAAQIAQEAQDRETALEQEKSSHMHLVIGISVAAGVIAFLTSSVGLWWFMSRRVRRGQGIWDSNHDYMPRAWQFPRSTAADTQQGHITAQPSLTSKLCGQTTYSPLENSYMDVSPIATVHFDRQPFQAQAGSSVNGVAFDSPPPTPPVQMTARERKMLEVHNRLPPGTSGSQGAPAAFSYSRSAQPALVDETLNPDIQPDIIIQHRDGGAGIVHELPPPYADRSPHSSPHTLRSPNVLSS